jgi:membrane fusion protein (multidrug efflux system)
MEPKTMNPKSARKRDVKAAEMFDVAVDKTAGNDGVNKLENPIPPTVPNASAADEAPSVSDIKEVESDTRTRGLRRVLLIAGPVVVATISLLVWLNSGRYAGTEDAYVKAEKVTVSAQVSGPIAAVAIHENQRVNIGDELFRVDDRPYRIALAKANAQLQAVTADVNSLKASFKQKSEELELARTNREFAEREFARQSQLAQQKLNSRSQLDEAKHKLDVARQQISVIEQEREQILSRLNGNPNLSANQHPDYLTAQANRDSAALELERTVVRAPFTGIASKVPQPGQAVSIGSAVMNVIATDNTWIEANFMETDLANVRVGQPVSVKVDSYPGFEWEGRVQSISQATGSEFSVLPAQNASGNWVKIVQRVPIRIAIKPGKDDPVLRVGMTAKVEIDTGKHHTVSSLFGTHRNDDSK